MPRELDAQVAVALNLDVVGVGWACPDPEVLDWWHPTSDGHSGMEMHPLFVAHCMCELLANEEPDEWTPDKMLGHYPGCLEVVAFYSEGIAAAWPVVEWMNREKKWIVKVESYWDGAASIAVSTDKGTPTYWRDLASGDAVTVPEAICRAFLAAMGK